MEFVNKYFRMMEKSNPHELKLMLVVVTILLLGVALVNNIFIDQTLNLFSYMVIHFLGYLFFLLIPVEGLFYYYLYEGYNPFILIIFSVATALLAQACNYVIGLLASKNVKSLIKPKRYLKLKNFLDKYGLAAIFVFNVSFLSSPILSLVAGITKMDYKEIWIYSFLGLSFKYIIIAFAFYLF